MTEPCDHFVSVLAGVHALGDWDCTDSADGTNRAVISTDRYYPNGDRVRLLVQVDQDQVIASDGGEAIGRLADQDIGPDDHAFESAWLSTLRRWRLHESGGRILLRLPIDRTPAGLIRLADALIALDSLVAWAHRPTHSPGSLTDEIAAYLEGLERIGKVTVGPQIRFQNSVTWTPTLSVQAPRGLTYVQAGDSNNRTRAIEHAFMSYSVAAQHGIEIGKRLSILSGDFTKTTAPMLQLSRISYIGFWRDRQAITSFLDGDYEPADHLLRNGATSAFTRT